ncbi:MAG: radical SAM protein [Planctomycetes bacterium]|nr:radical SAM protein [Planctomycetota bacterium]
MKFSEFQKNTHVFKIYDRCFAIIKYTKQSFEISEKLYDFLNGSSDDLSLLSQTEDDLLVLQKYGYIDLSPSEKTVNSLDCLSLSLISDCNLACSYCSVGPSGSYNSDYNGTKMSIETARKCVDFLAQNSRTNKLEIIFFGGEPLLNMETMLYVLDYCTSKYSDKEWIFKLITNGTLIDDDISGILSKHRVSVTVSLTGPGHIHGRDRVTRDGKNSYDHVISGLRNLEKHGVDFVVKAIMTNLEESAEIKDHLKSLNLKGRIHVTFEHSLVGDNEIGVIQLMKKGVQECLEKVSITKVLKEFPHGLDTVLMGESAPDAVCHAGRSSLFVGSTGDIYSCHISAGANAREYLFGNINRYFNEEGFDRVKSGFDLTLPQCKSCWANAICEKGCNLQRQRLGKIPEHWCDWFRWYIESSVYMSAHLDVDVILKSASIVSSSYERESLKTLFYLNRHLRNSLKHIFPMFLYPISASKQVENRVSVSS